MNFARATHARLAWWLTRVAQVSAALAIGWAAPALFADEPAARDERLAARVLQARGEQARLADGVELLRGELKSGGEAPATRFALGVGLYLLAHERSLHDLWALGLPNVVGGLEPPPVEKRKAPTYAAARDLLARFAADLQAASDELALVASPEVKLRLRPGKFALDVDRDGRPDALLGDVFLPLAMWKTDGEVAFDAADARLLRAAAHAELALVEFVLAHDFHEQHEFVARHYFQSPDAKPDEPPPETRDRNSEGLAMLHLTRWPVVEPKRLARALAHWETASRQARLALDRLETEMDDDREFFGGALQNSCRWRVSEARAARFRQLLDHADALLAGEEVAPLLRDFRLVGFFSAELPPTVERGVNVRRVFLEPTTFDLIGWVQGVAARPYIEKREPDVAFWKQTLQELFQNELLRLDEVPDERSRP